MEQSHKWNYAKDLNRCISKEDILIANEIIKIHQKADDDDDRGSGGGGGGDDDFLIYFKFCLLPCPGHPLS